MALFQVPGFDRLLYVTDAAMNIAPDLEAKKHIIGNAVKVAHALGNPNPIVACLCAVEKVNPKMPATLDAAALVEACLLYTSPATKGPRRSGGWRFRLR